MVAVIICILLLHPIPHDNHLHHDMPGIHPLLQEKVYLKQPVSGIFFVAAESDPYVDTGCFFLTGTPLKILSMKNLG